MLIFGLIIGMFLGAALVFLGQTLGRRAGIDGDTTWNELREPEVTWLVGGQPLIGVHAANQCVGTYCTVHNPSDHHMRTWTQNWRSDRRLMERICPHGIGHPDPDDINPDTVHGCDLCCQPPAA
jgi:hypothetical protein